MITNIPNTGDPSGLPQQNEQKVEKGIDYSNPIISQDRKGRYLAILAGCKKHLFERFADCTVDFWDLVSCERLWSCQEEATVPNQGTIQLTEDLHVVLPRKISREEILVFADGKKKATITKSRLTLESTRVVGNNIVASTNETFFVWNTNGDLLWNESFQNNQGISWLIGSSQKYFVSQFGRRSYYPYFTKFQSSSSLFVANLEKGEVSFCQLDLDIDEGVKIDAYNLSKDILYVSTSVEKSNPSGFGRIDVDPKILKVDLLNMKQTGIFISPFNQGEITYMSSSPSQFVFVQERRFVELDKTVFRFVVLSPNLIETINSFQFESVSTDLGFGKCTFFNPSNGYICSDDQIKEVSSISDKTGIKRIDTKNSFVEDVFLSFGSYHPDSGGINYFTITNFLETASS